MAINLVEIVRLKYPGQIEAGNVIFRQPEDDILIQYWNVEGVPQPSESSLLAEAGTYEQTYALSRMKMGCKNLIESLISSTVAQKDYRSGSSCASYAFSTNPQWKAEADAFILWRDALYTAAYQVFEDVQNGQPAPTEQEFLALLPTLIWP